MFISGRISTSEYFVACFSSYCKRSQLLAGSRIAGLGEFNVVLPWNPIRTKPQTFSNRLQLKSFEFQVCPTETLLHAMLPLGDGMYS